MTGENADLRDCYETKIQAAVSARLSPDPDAAGRPGRGPFCAGDQAPAEQRPEQHYAAVQYEVRGADHQGECPDLLQPDLPGAGAVPVPCRLVQKSDVPARRCG